MNFHRTKHLTMSILLLGGYFFLHDSEAQIVDYPTLDRILFVEECLRAHPQRLRQEMIYKCACALDSLAGEIPYSEYTDQATAANASSIAGERGSVLRGDAVMALARRYRDSVAKAEKACLIRP